MNPPFLHVFVDFTDHEQESQNSYLYDTTVKANLVIPQHEIQQDDRPIHKYTEKLENLLLRNRQIVVRDDIRTKQFVLKNSNYEFEPESYGMEGVDGVEYTISCQYSRTVILR